MLRSLLIINNAGLVIFIRSWIPLGLVDEEKELIRMGSVFHAIQDQSKQSTKCAPTYIEFTTVASSFVFNSTAGLMCILLHDIEDGSDFGSLLAEEILKAFTDKFGARKEAFGGAVHMDSFQEFHQILPDAMTRNVERKILYRLQGTRGIKGCMYKTRSGGVAGAIAGVDEFSIGANIADLEAASDLLVPRSDDIDWISLTISKEYIIYIHRFGECALVSQCRNNVSKQKYIHAIENAVSLLIKLSELEWKLQG